MFSLPPSMNLLHLCPSFSFHAMHPIRASIHPSISRHTPQALTQWGLCVNPGHTLRTHFCLVCSISAGGSAKAPQTQFSIEI